MLDNNDLEQISLQITLVFKHYKLKTCKTQRSVSSVHEIIRGKSKQFKRLVQFMLRHAFVLLIVCDVIAEV